MSYVSLQAIDAETNTIIQLIIKWIDRLSGSLSTKHCSKPSNGALHKVERICACFKVKKGNSRLYAFSVRCKPRRCCQIYCSERRLKIHVRTDLLFVWQSYAIDLEFFIRIFVASAHFEPLCVFGFVKYIFGICQHNKWIFHVKIESKNV